MFEDDICWYSHSLEGKKHNPQRFSLKEFKCNFCEKTFDNKGGFMKHRKQEHSTKVYVFRNEKDNWCTFSSERCWYRHEEPVAMLYL